MRGIYAIVNEGAPDPVAIASDALRAGVRIVQYRAKPAPVAATVMALRALTAEFDALFFVNDAWELALECEADGVHLGPEDAAPEELPAIRARLGTRLLGLSCATPAEALAARAAGADYIGVGSVYATHSKSDAGEPIGIAGLQRVAAAAALPVAAIGGITAQTIGEVARSGVAMAAVISAIAQARDPHAAAAALVQAWER